MNKFYLCSSSVVERFPNVRKSMPFKSGYLHDMDSNYYIIELSQDKYNEIEKFYLDNEDELIDFFFHPCVSSFVPSLDDFSITDLFGLLKTDGLFVVIEKLWNLTNESNIAFCIYKLQQEYYPNYDDLIEFVNMIIKEYEPIWTITDEKADDILGTLLYSLNEVPFGVIKEGVIDKKFSKPQLNAFKEILNDIRKEIK